MSYTLDDYGRDQNDVGVMSLDGNIIPRSTAVMRLHMKLYGAPSAASICVSHRGFCGTPNSRYITAAHNGDRCQWKKSQLGMSARDSCEVIYRHDFPFLAIGKFDKTSTFRLIAEAMHLWAQLEHSCRVFGKSGSRSSGYPAPKN